MKKILLLIIFISSVILSRAQRFFYVETNLVTDKPLREGLLKASQFITKSPLVSDYIINTDVGFLSGSNILYLKMNVKDSVTFKTIFQTSEEYSFGVINENARIVLRMAIKIFLEKNINQIILCAREDHYDARMKWLKPKKDKT